MDKRHSARQARMPMRVTHHYYRTSRATRNPFCECLTLAPYLKRVDEGM